MRARAHTYTTACLSQGAQEAAQAGPRKKEESNWILQVLPDLFSHNRFSSNKYLIHPHQAGERKDAERTSGEERDGIGARAAQDSQPRCRRALPDNG